MNYRKPILLLLVLLAVILFGSQLVYAGDGNLYALIITRGARVIANARVELAVMEKERAKGLMFRKSLPPDQGMWFIFDGDTSNPFWMKNTFIPLDIIFVDSNTSIVTIHKDAKPFSTDPIAPDKDYRYVLEVPAGFSDLHGLKKGDKIRLHTTDYITPKE